jgi:ribonuclease P protein component
MSLNQRFRKNERLCSQKRIKSLFEEGKSFNQYPFRVIWSLNKLPGDSPARIVVSVPKKRFKKAVDRNLIRRRIKEAYRKKKHSLYSSLEHSDRQVDFMIIYVADTILDYQLIDNKISALLVRFQKELQISD